MTVLDHEDIRTIRYVTQQCAISIELIHHMLGGPNMEFRFTEVGKSFEAFDFLHQELIENLQ